MPEAAGGVGAGAALVKNPPVLPWFANNNEVRNLVYAKHARERLVYGIFLDIQKERILLLFEFSFAFEASSKLET